MYAVGFKGLLEQLEDKELIELIYLDPTFLHKLCYMLSLEYQLEKISKSYDRT